VIALVLLLAADTSVKSVAEVRGFAHVGAQVTTQQAVDELEAGARIEADAFDDRDASARVERLWLAFPAGPVAITLGDVHAQLGRGLSLSLRPLSGVGVDTALRGAQAKLALGDVEVLALAGLANPANFDPLTLAPLSDPNDAIAGVEAVLNAPGVRVGVVSSAVLPRERLIASEQDATVTGGAFFDVSMGAFGFALEADAQQKRLAGSFAPGTAVSTSARYDLAALSIVVDALWLSGFEVRGSRNDALGVRFDYGRAPALERADVQSVPSGDLAGARVTALLPWGLEASAMTTVTNAKTIIDADVVAHASFGALGLGVRDEGTRRMARVDAEGALDLGHGFALTSSTRAQVWNDHVLGTTTVGAQNGVAAVAIEGGVDTEHKRDGDRVWFLAVIASLDVGPATIRAVGGSQRGGFRCAGGVCREVPAFTGARLEVDARF
jgi:hypothetical protein